MKTGTNRTRGPGGAKTDAPSRRVRTGTAKGGALTRMYFAGGEVLVGRARGQFISKPAKSIVTVGKKVLVRRRAAPVVHALERRILDAASGKLALREVAIEGRSDDDILADVLGRRHTPRG